MKSHSLVTWVCHRLRGIGIRVLHFAEGNHGPFSSHGLCTIIRRRGSRQPPNLRVPAPGWFGMFIHLQGDSLAIAAYFTGFGRLRRADVADRFHEAWTCAGNDPGFLEAGPTQCLYGCGPSRHRSKKCSHPPACRRCCSRPDFHLCVRCPGHGWV